MVSLPMALPTLVFDLDGTLANTAPDIIGTLNMILASLGHTPLSDDRAMPLIGEGARALLVAGLAEAGVVVTPDELEPLFDRFLTIYEGRIADESHLYPGVSDTLEQLVLSGYRLAVCTNKLENQARALIEKLGIARHFSAICGRNTFAFAKPDARHLTETILQSGGDPKRAIMIGDSITDIQTARNAGLPVIAVTFGYTATPVAMLNPDQIIDHYDTLSVAIDTLIGIHFS
jgi:phosphoglycolate phosphatase